jgi:hypothetical protein
MLCYGAPVTATDTTESTAPTRCPTDFRYVEMLERPRVRRMRRLLIASIGFDPVPPPDVAEAFCEDMFAGDPVAEAFVADALAGPQRRRTRRLLDTALESPHGFAAVAAEAPESMRALFAEFETVPEWVDRDLVEEGARIWRRWGRTLFNVAGAETLEMYTESAVAVPLSLAGGYAGDNALRRFLETARFWIDVSEPGALFRLGSAGRATAMRVRVMHVNVRRRVVEHPEWSVERWGLPICQSYMTMTLMGGSVAPAMLMWPLGYLTSPHEIRALLHYQRYLGHLLGVRPRHYPETVRGGIQLLFLTAAARSYTAGEHGAELIESFPRAFAPRPETTGLRRWRAHYEHRLMGAYTVACMSPRTRARYDMPAALPWLLLLVARVPYVLTTEIARRAVPAVGEWVERRAVRERERWWEEQMAGRKAAFEAASQLRR